MAKIKYPSNYLKSRRESLGITQRAVAEATGIEFWALQKLEQRGEIPEVHMEKLAKVLQISVLDLQIERCAPLIRTVFQIPTETFRRFVLANVGKDRAFGKMFAAIKKDPREDADFARLPESHKAVIRHVRSLTVAEGFKELIESGIYLPNGDLAPEYDGPPRKK